MITLRDDDVVGLINVMFDTAETIMTGLVRRGLFNQSEVEWFLTDVWNSVNANVGSDLARRRISDKLDQIAAILQDEELVCRW